MIFAQNACRRVTIKELWNFIFSSYSIVKVRMKGWAFLTREMLLFRVSLHAGIFYNVVTRDNVYS